MMLAVKGIYDGKVVRLLKPVEVERPYQVEVIFLERIGKDLSAAGEGNLERFIGDVGRFHAGRGECISGHS